MAKKTKKKESSQPIAEIVEKIDDRTPEQRLRDDWAKGHRAIAPFITIKGEIRGNLRPSQIEQAKKLLKGYGFEV